MNLQQWATLSDAITIYTVVKKEAHPERISLFGPPNNVIIIPYIEERGIHLSYRTLI